MKKTYLKPVLIKKGRLSQVTAVTNGAGSGPVEWSRSTGLWPDPGACAPDIGDAAWRRPIPSRCWSRRASSRRSPRTVLPPLFRAKPFHADRSHPDTVGRRGPFQSM